MANKAISELPQAQNVQNQDLFVLEQSGIAKKLAAETFITEQGIIDALAEALDGHGGIQSVTLQSLSGRVRTYRITFTDGSATTFQVLDGTSIDRIVKTSTAGLTDTYTVFMNDGTTSFFQVRNGQDGSATWDQINGKAPIITETVAGAVVNFPDGAEDIPVTSLVANIEPKQSGSGDPSPSNIRPISGWTGCNVTRAGKNLVRTKDNSRTNAGVTYTVNADGSIQASGTASGNSWFRAGGDPKDYGTFLHAGSYSLSGGISRNEVLYIIGMYIDGTGIAQSSVSGSIYDRGNGTTFTLLQDAYITYQIQIVSGTTVNALFKPMIRISSDTSSEFASYAGNTYTIQLGDTVYGGTIDVATGLLTVTDANIASYNGETLPSTWISDRDVYAQGTTPTTGAQVVYKLATPQTYQLTPQQLATLFGNNTVWSDLGDVTVTYPADTKLYIEKLTQPTEDDMTANQAISSGTFFMVGNTLYKATAAIANGATITPGTNATKLSLADALNLLNT